MLPAGAPGPDESCLAEWLWTQRQPGPAGRHNQFRMLQRTPKKDRSPRHGTTQPRVSSGRPTPRCSYHEAKSKGGAAEARRNPDVSLLLARRSSAPNAACRAASLDRQPSAAKELPLLTCQGRGSSFWHSLGLLLLLPTCTRACRPRGALSCSPAEPAARTHGPHAQLRSRRGGGGAAPRAVRRARKPDGSSAPHLRPRGSETLGRTGFGARQRTQQICTERASRRPSQPWQRRRPVLSSAGIEYRGPS